MFKRNICTQLNVSFYNTRKSFIVSISFVVHIDEVDEDGQEDHTHLYQYGE